MKRLAWILAFPLLVSLLGRAQSAPPASSSQDAEAPERMFFPRDMFWGWAQFDLAPPHNEIDPNLCAGNAGQSARIHSVTGHFVDLATHAWRARSARRLDRGHL